jgi:hypothetical protein
MWPRAADIRRYVRLRELFERIKYLESGTPEVSIVACCDRQPVAPGGGGDIAVFNGHTLAGFVERALLLGPHMGNRHVEPVNSSLERIDKSREPGLEKLTLPSLFGAHPIGQLSNDDGTGVAAVLLLIQPRDDPRIALPLGRLADDVCVE